MNSETITIIGIDPGVNGAISIFESGIHHVFKMPETLTETADLIHKFSNSLKCAAYIEQVHSMPGQGVSSTFRFGQSYGELRGVVSALQIPFYQVTPQAWQKYLQCPKAEKKDKKRVNKQRAQELFPKLSKQITNQTADSLLICEYGRQKHWSNQQ